MEVILKESIKSLGSAGDIVNVADGYARNYLIPQGKAVLATSKNVKQLERQQEAIRKRAAQLKADLEALAAQLNKLEIEVPVKVGESGKLYGSVTSMDIAKAISDKGYTVDRKKIQLEEPIKELGEYSILIKLAPEVEATVKLNVVAQKD